MRVSKHLKVLVRTATMWDERWLRGRVSDSGARGRGFDTYLRRVVSLSIDTFTCTPPKSTGNTQETLAPSRHDRKIVDWAEGSFDKSQSVCFVLIVV